MVDTNWLRIWIGTILVGLSFLAANSGQAFAQPDEAGRDLGRTPSPQQLFERLQRFRTPGDTAMFDQLQKMGRDIFSSLSPEEKEKAKQFAEQMIRNRGIESEEVASLMDRMGVPAEARQQLADQLGSQPTASSRGMDASTTEKLNSLFENYEDAIRSPSNRESQSSSQPSDRRRPRRSNNQSPQPSEPGPPKSTGQDMAELFEQLDRLRPKGTKFDEQRPDADPTSRTSAPSSTQNSETRPEAESPVGDDQWARSFYNYAEEALPEIQKSIARGDFDPAKFSPSRIDQLKAAVRDLQSQGEDREGLGAMLSKGKDLLTNSMSNSASKEKLEARFDRLLVDAAKSSIQAAAEHGDKDMLSKALDSVLDSAQDLAKDSLKSKRERQRKQRAARGRDRTGNARPQFQDNEFARDLQSITQSDQERDSTGDTTIQESPDQVESAGLDASSSLAGFDWSTWLLIGVGLAGLIGVGYAAFKLSPSSDPIEAKRRELARVLTSHSLRSPEGFVDAVDLYLLAHHGPKSNWWNATRAQQVVQQQRPQLRGQISNLFHAYTLARYSPDHRLLEAQRSNAESALKRLVASHQETSRADDDATSTILGLED